MTASDDERPPPGGIHPSRRTLLRGAAVAGGLVWAAPVVQTLAPPAFAAGSPGSGVGLSFVAALIQVADGDRYRIKWEFNDDGSVSSSEAGRTFNVPCAGEGFFRDDVTVSQTGPPGGVLVSAAGSRQGFQLTVAPGVTLVDWVVKQETCCLRKTGGGTASSQPGPAGSNYAVSITPGVPAGSGNMAFTWPAAPNKAPCQLP